MVELELPERTSTRSGPEPVSDMMRQLTLNGLLVTGDGPSVPMFSTVNDPMTGPEDRHTRPIRTDTDMNG